MGRSLLSPLSIIAIDVVWHHRVLRAKLDQQKTTTIRAEMGTPMAEVEPEAVAGVVEGSIACTKMEEGLGMIMVYLVRTHHTCVFLALRAQLAG
jgi:hypothetical protein